MTDRWVDIRAVFPELSAGPIGSIDAGSESFLTNTLRDHGFQLFFLEGSRITAEDVFFREAAASFEFPDYFGKNWDAFNDCLGELIEDGPPRIGVIWRNSSASAAQHLPTVVAAVHLLLNAAEAVRHEELAVVQMEIFLLGEGDGFVRVSNQSNI